MSRPAVGTTLKGAGLTEVDNRFYSRGPLVAVLIRDNLGEDTDVSPYAAGTPPTINYTPFAVDGELRDDLLARHKVAGEWVANPDPNEGWFCVRALDEKGGPQRTTDAKDDDAMILQSNYPFDTDLISEGKSVEFTAVETLDPLLMRLRMNLPLNDTDGTAIVEYPGEPDFVLSKPVDAEPVDRQLQLIFARKHSGLWLYHVEAYPLVKLRDIGNFRRSKTDADAPSLSYRALPDPYHVDRDPTDPDSTELVPVLYSEFVGGGLWASLNTASSSS